MDESELKAIAEEIARFVIDDGRVEAGEWFIHSLAVEVMMVADERGYDNATEISEMAVQLYSK